MNAREAYIALNMMDRVGPVTVRLLVDELGSAEAIFEVDDGHLQAIRGIGRDQLAALLRQRSSIEWEREIERADLIGARIVTQIDSEYPAWLMDIYDPPLALYVMGKLEKRDKHSIAVVGARRPSHYGRETAARLSRQLSKAGLTVVSGLAHGIDTAAHEAVLAVQGRTLAVIGSALDCVYPESNRAMAQKISEDGALISEFALGRFPDKTTFPMRNRIVSGLSMGVLVVEAGRKSGSLITANQALGQGRSVFAVPGRIDSPLSVGTHGLLKSGARLVETVDDILQEYEFVLPGISRSMSEISNKQIPVLSEQEEILVGLLSGGEQDIDSLIRNSSLKPAQVSGLLIGLEMKRMVRMLPGGIVERR